MRIATTKGLAKHRTHLGLGELDTMRNFAKILLQDESLNPLCSLWRLVNHRQSPLMKYHIAWGSLMTMTLDLVQPQSKLVLDLSTLKGWKAELRLSRLIQSLIISTQR